MEDPIFRRLAYEVAFSEYAIALAQELAKRDEYRDPTDPIFDIRETLNRVARKGASLYAQCPVVKSCYGNIEVSTARPTNCSFDIQGDSRRSTASEACAFRGRTGREEAR